MNYYNDYYYDEAVEEAAGLVVGMVFVSFIISIAIAIVCGIISKKINESKGRYGGFAWGFFLGAIGIIIVACRSDLNNTNIAYTTNSEYDNKLKSLANEKDENSMLRDGGWRCNKCSAVNPKYASSCKCGLSWTENKNFLQNQQKEKLHSYKEMLDEGLITQEEFEAKKKQVLEL